MIAILFRLTAAVLVSQVAVALAADVVLQPGPDTSKDIWTTSVFSFAPGGGGPGGGLADDLLKVGGWGDEYRSLLQFDLTGQPPIATSVVLTLYNLGDNGGSPTPMQLYRITAFWDWRTMGTGSDHDRLWWADQPPASLWTSSILPSPALGSSYQIDITDLYNAWQNGTYPNYGLELRPTSTNNNFNFFTSSRYSDPQLRPKLSISTNLMAGARVMSPAGGVNVRDASLGSILFVQTGGVHGSIVGNSISRTVNGTTGNWWQINWDSAPPNVSGQAQWSAESVLLLAPHAGEVPQPDFLSSYYAPVNGHNNLSLNIFVQSGEAPTSNPLASDFNAVALGNCTWYAYGRLLELGANAQQLSALTQNAGNWATQAEAANILVDKNPAVGSIAQSTSQNHVAVVESVNVDGTITVTESSYVASPNDPWNFRWRHRTVSPSWFDNFIHVPRTASSATTTSIAASPNPSLFGQPVTLTATVASSGGIPTGTVTFKDGTRRLNTVTVSGNKATFITAALEVGSHSISAVYDGDGHSDMSISIPLTQIVNGNNNVQQLSIAVAGGGQVTSSPAAISCPATCNANVAVGTQVILTATPIGSGSFTGWNGACSGTGTCILTMNSAQSLSAIFTQSGSGQSPNRTFVAAGGSDGNPCTFALPCRTFQHAHDTVAAGGEIDVLDAAGYGALTITKAISIQGHGFAGVTASGGATAITVNASGTDHVSLRGLLLDGVGAGLEGVSFIGGAALEISQCLVRNFQSNGIRVALNASGGLSIANTLVSDNGATGLAIFASSNVVSATLNRARMDNNNAGIVASGSGGAVNLAVRESIVVNNETTGIFANGAGSIIGVAGSTITGNGTGWSAASSGQLISYGNNNLIGNLSDGAATLTISSH